VLAKWVMDSAGNSRISKQKLVAGLCNHFSEKEVAQLLETFLEKGEMSSLKVGMDNTYEFT
jgi:hypothetical protein